MRDRDFPRSTTAQSALYVAYIPILEEAGNFVPTTRTCKLREDIYCPLTLPTTLSAILQ